VLRLQLDAELEEIKAAEEAASAKPGEETVLPAYYMDASLRAKDVAHSPEVGVGTPTSPLASALLDTAQRSRLGALKGQSTNEEEGDDGRSPFGVQFIAIIQKIWTFEVDFCACCQCITVCRLCCSTICVLVLCDCFMIPHEMIKLCCATAAHETVP
jgi:hypothetical protein